MLEPPVEQENPASLVLNAPAFDENKLLIYRELYYDGFSSIIAARDLTTGTPVALKKVDYLYLSKAPLPVRQLQRRFSRKVRSQAAKIRAMSHHSILKLVEFVVEPNRILIVTEMCMFGDLFNWMLQQPNLRVRDISLVFQYVFEAIRYLHSQDFVHGFLSPTHVLFQAMSPQSVTIMPDLSVRNELLGLTSGALPIVDCWAPEGLEQLQKLQSVSHDSAAEDDASSERPLLELSKPMDIWSVACIMHIALTGKSPFVADSLSDMLAVIKNCDGQLQHPMFQTLSPKMCSQLSNWLRLDPAERPPAERCFEDHWFDDEYVRTDNRNLLLITEYDLMHTYKRYRTRGRYMFDAAFTPKSLD